MTGTIAPYPLLLHPRVTCLYAQMSLTRYLGGAIFSDIKVPPSDDNPPARHCSLVYTLSSLILFLNSASIDLVFVISLNQFSRHSLRLSSFGARTFHMPIPFSLLDVPQPTTAQLSPGMPENMHVVTGKQ